MDARQRRELTRYGAPAAFLLAVTVAVLLIKAGLAGHSAATTAQTSSTFAPTTTAQTTTVASTATTAARFYTVQPGDTLGAIALREHTTVAELERLNPGIDPQALHSGQRVRVG